MIASEQRRYEGASHEEGPSARSLLLVHPHPAAPSTWHVVCLRSSVRTRSPEGRTDGRRGYIEGFSELNRCIRISDSRMVKRKLLRVPVAKQYTNEHVATAKILKL